MTTNSLKIIKQILMALTLISITNIINCGFSQSAEKEAKTNSENSAGVESSEQADPEKFIMPLDWSVKSLEGEEFLIAERFPNQVLFINIWATWCGPCRWEMPSIEKLYDQFKGRVAFLCISQESPEVIDKFMKKAKYNLPIYYRRDYFPAEFTARGLPTTYIITTNGELAYRYVGAADWSDETVVDFLNSLL